MGYRQLRLPRYVAMYPILVIPTTAPLEVVILWVGTYASTDFPTPANKVLANSISAERISYGSRDTITDTIHHHHTN